MSNEKSQTLIEEGTEFKGTLTSKCPVFVRGELSGDVRSPELTIAKTGVVRGNIKAATIESQGVLAGTVDATDIKLGGEVQDNTVIRAKTLEVQLSTEEGRLEVTFGKCTLEVGDEPTDAPAGESKESESSSDEGAEESEEESE